MKKTGLLILIGGRQMPNFLTAQYLKPDLIMPIASKDEIAEGKWKKLKPTFEPLCGNLAEYKEVDAFDLAEIKSKCYEAIDENPGIEWVFNVTCATTVMSIAAYEVAKENCINCWYLDTNTRQVLALVGCSPKSDLFNIGIEDYMLIHDRKIDHSLRPKATEKTCKIVRILGENPTLADSFHQSLRVAISDRIAKKKVKTDEMQLTVDKDLLELYKLANEEGFIENLQILANNRVSFSEKGVEETKFINGDWLGMFVWLIAKGVNSFSSVDYSFRVARSEEGMYEIDFALTFSGMLLIAECKTEKKPFKGSHLDHLVAVANQLGSNFVGKMFITNQFLEKNNRGHDGFCEQAKHQQIVIIDGARLSNLASILTREAGVEMANLINPTYFRG